MFRNSNNNFGAVRRNKSFGQQVGLRNRFIVLAVK